MDGGGWLVSIALGLAGVLTAAGLLAFLWIAGLVTSALRDTETDEGVARLMIVMSVVFIGAIAVFVAVALRRTRLARVVAGLSFLTFMVFALVLTPGALRDFWGWGWVWMPVVVAIGAPLASALAMGAQAKSPKATAAGG